MPHHFKILLALFLASAAAGCKPRSNAHPTPVPDGTVVLFRRGTEYGAAILQNQTMSPETIGYRWFLRKDGRGIFDTNAVGVTSGTVTNATGIQFGNFSAQWSINRDGWGWFYYPQERATVATNRWFMCITSETNIAGLDAAASKWRYRDRREFSFENNIYWPF
jgi:hypothetical protein